MSVTRIKNSGSSGAKYKTFTAGYPGKMAAPTTVTGLSGTSVSVEFTAQAGATSYVVVSSPGSITATGSSSPITVTGLTTDTPYTFQVAAVNAVGQGAYSDASASVTPVTQGFATQISMSSSSSFYAMDYNATDNSILAGGGYYTGTRREEGIAKINATTGVPIWVKAQYNGTNQGYTCGVGIQQSLGYVCEIGYMGGQSGMTVTRRNLSNGTISSTNGMTVSGATSTASIQSKALAMNGNTPFGALSLSGYTPGRAGIMRFNTGMSESWTRTIGANETNYSFNLEAIDVDSSNNLYLAGSGIYTDYRNYVAKVDSNPNLLYMTRINADATNLRQIGAVAYDSSGNLYAGGRSNGGTKPGWIAKFNTSGNLLFAKDITISNADNFRVQSMAVDSSGNIYAAGNFNLTTGATYERGFLIKFDSSGAIVWQRYIYAAPANYYEFNQMKINGNFIYFAGAAGVPGSGAPRLFAMQYTTSGNPSSLVQTLGPITDFTISNGGFTVSNSTLTVTSVSSPTFATGTTSLVGQSLTDNTPSYTTNTITF